MLTDNTLRIYNAKQKLPACVCCHTTMDRREMNFKKRKNGNNSEAVGKLLKTLPPHWLGFQMNLLFFLCYYILTHRCSHTQTQSPVHYFSMLDEETDGQQMDGSLEISKGDNVKYFFSFFVLLFWGVHDQCCSLEPMDHLTCAVLKREINVSVLYPMNWRLSISERSYTKMFLVTKK